MIFLFSTILDILEIEVFNILCNPGNIGNFIFPIFPYPGNIGNTNLSIFWYFFKKDARAEISRRMQRSMPRDLSYETDSGPKTKTDQSVHFILCSYYLKASPLPPAPLATSGLLICILKGLAGIEKLVSRIEINEKMKNINLFVIHLIIGFC